MPERRLFGTELAERMERADQLKERDIVFTRCSFCKGVWHRGWLVERVDGLVGFGQDGVMRLASGWKMEPNPHPLAGSSARFIIADDSVPAGYVWRVIDEKRDDVVYETELQATEEYAAALAKRPRVPVPAGERN